jgi:pumilio RNA-binding family
MEGSFFAINNLISQQNSNLNPRLGSSNNALLAFNSEKQSYLSYYGTGASPNLRLPTPPIPRENQHPGRHAVKFGTNWGLAPIDDNSKNSLHLSQGLLSTHKEELEGDHSPKEPLDSLANTTNGFWSGGDAAPLAGQSKRLVDIIQVAIFIHRNLFIDLTINYCAWIPHYIIYCPVGFRRNLPALK